jgi:glycine/D-amino acid oxidase-like deaminating enzyme
LTAQTFSAQLAIIGGGIAGLWLLNRLCDAGYDAVLLEQSGLGAGQTLASQGIIHGGLKYALNGVLSPASSAIAGMPERWRQCMAGRGEIDLRSCRVLSPHYYMWSDAGYRSRLKTFLGSKALQGRIDALKPAQYPAFFRNAGSSISGTLYQLTDFVVDTPSLLQVLSARYRDRIFSTQALQLVGGQQPDSTGVLIRRTAGDVRLEVNHCFLCAGSGNEELLQQADDADDRLPDPAMQRRPLRMVYLRHRYPDPLFVHCIGDSFGMTPRLTITTHPAADGEHVYWYLGGELAERGVERSDEAQCAMARQLLRELLPWLDLSSAKFGSFLIDRAEPRVSNLQRPDTAYLSAQTGGRRIVVWPTKLTLAPDLGDAALSMLQRQGFLPAGDAPGGEDTAGRGLGRYFDFPGFATPPWEPLPAPRQAHTAGEAQHRYRQDD